MKKRLPENKTGFMFISDRTLQPWRILYSRIGNKIYYRQSDIEKLLQSRMVWKEK